MCPLACWLARHNLLIEQDIQVPAFVNSRVLYVGYVLHLTALRDGHVLDWLSFWVCKSPGVLNLGDHVHALDYVAEDDMLSVQMRCPMLCCDDEELATVCLYQSALRLSIRSEKPTFGPLLAIDSSPGLSCFNVKFSSANFSVP